MIHTMPMLYSRNFSTKPWMDFTSSLIQCSCAVAQYFHPMRRSGLTSLHLIDNCCPIGRLPSGATMSCKQPLVVCVCPFHLLTMAAVQCCWRFVSGSTISKYVVWSSIKSRLSICVRGMQLWVISRPPKLRLAPPSSSSIMLLFMTFFLFFILDYSVLTFPFTCQVLSYA